MQARHGSYRANRGLDEMQLGHIGRLQQFVVNIPECCDEVGLKGGSDDEQARQSIVVRSIYNLEDPSDISI